MTGSDRASALACITASATLAAQVLVHRVVSLKLLNNYAFLVVSLTMLGLGFSGVLLTRWLTRFMERESDWLSLAAAGFSVTLIGATSLIFRAGGDVSTGVTRPDFVIDFLRWLPYALLFAVPFTFSGLILGTLLSAPIYPTRRVYFFDLLGSSAGALLILPLIGAIGVEAAIVVVAATQLAVAVVLLRPRELSTRVVVGAAAAFVIASGVFSSSVLAYTPSKDTPLAVSAATPDTELLYTTWDALGRTEITRLPKAPDGFVHESVFGDDAGYRSRVHRLFTQNNFTWTFGPYYDGTPATLVGVDRTLYATPYIVSSVKHPRVAAIGVGGGSDILAALRFDAEHVTGIEANAGTLRILREMDRDYFSKWVTDPRVELVHDEGRHFLASSDKRFDIIEFSGVDTYSGTPGAAHVFTENYLYTLEAFDLFFSRLTDDGIFTVARAEWQPPREMIRAEATAVQMLRARGIEHPAQHIMMLRTTNQLLVSLMVKRTPFTEEEQSRIEAWTKSGNIAHVAAGPRWNASKHTVYSAFLSLDSASKETLFITSYWANIRPVDDDQPFFFRYSYWSHLFPRSGALWEHTPYMEMSVVMLLAVIGFVSFLCLYVPLRRLKKEREQRAAPWRFGVYFAALGLGYMGIEMALLQKFGLFLGHPNYALSVVLAGLLFATGLGSLFAERIVQRLGGVRFVAYAVVAVVLVEHLLILPRLYGIMSASLIVRVLVTLVLIAPIGISLGVFMPFGLERLKKVSPALVPWAWGVNGLFSVLGPVLAIAWSITFGIGALLVTSLPIYLIAGWLLGSDDGEAESGKTPDAVEGPSASEAA